MKQGKVTINKKEAEDLFHTVDNEGFGYYLTGYGPDIDLLVKLGFSEEDLMRLLQDLLQLATAISNLEEMIDYE